jgi:hypothetical protein
MTPHDAPQFLVALSAVAEVFEREFSDAAQMLYFDALRDLPLIDCLQALEMASRTKTFMPRPAELRALIVPDDSNAIEQAWLEYKRQARVVGAYQSPTFQDGAIAATLVAIFRSWEQACGADLSPELWVAKRREFERVYRSYRDRGLTHGVTLEGFCARKNYETGWDEPRPGTARQLPAGDVPQLPASVRRRLAATSEEEREIWRQNVARALETREDTPADQPVTAMEPLRLIARRVPLEPEP